ncbi:MAG: hypothetical protein M0026_01675 [Nocardiopsaceae bacterium]|nr:hypothetical protein [Nocardiopsaceae bacterium]
MELAGLLAQGVAAENAPWLWGGAGLLVGAVIAAVVIRHRP